MTAERPNEPPAEILSTDEAARFLRLPNRRAFLSLARREGIPIARLGRGYRVRRSALIEFVKQTERAIGFHYVKI